MSEDNGDPEVVHLPQKPAPGHEFRVSAPATMSLPEVRKLIRDRLGFEGYIKTKIGPFRMTERGTLDAPVEPVDDKYIVGKFKITSIQIGWCTYFGYLKKPEGEV